MAKIAEAKVKTYQAFLAELERINDDFILAAGVARKNEDAKAFIQAKTMRGEAIRQARHNMDNA